MSIFDLASARTIAEQMLTDTCDVETASKASDGRGGQTNTYANRLTGIPCRLSAANVGVPLRDAGQKATQVTRFFLALQSSITIYNTDRVITAAGNNGTLRTLEVEDCSGSTDGLTRQVLVKQIS